MLKGIDENGNLQNVFVSEDGAVKVKLSEESTDNKTENTILANVFTVGTTSTAIEINQKISNIMVANYSETADVTINNEYKIGPNLAIELPINADVSSLNIISTEDNTKIQLVVKGVV